MKVSNLIRNLSRDEVSQKVVGKKYRVTAPEGPGYGHGFRIGTIVTIGNVRNDAVSFGASDDNGNLFNIGASELEVIALTKEGLIEKRNKLEEDLNKTVNQIHILDVMDLEEAPEEMLKVFDVLQEVEGANSQTIEKAKKITERLFG
jgi:hypothetical protein